MAPPAHSVLIQGQIYTQLSRSTVGMLQEHARRQVVLRTGRQFNAARSQNIEAWVCQERGRLSEAECDHCKNSYGPFTSCVVFPGHIHGSCANCHYGSSSSRCSIRKGISIRNWYVTLYWLSYRLRECCSRYNCTYPGCWYSYPSSCTCRCSSCSIY